MDAADLGLFIQAFRAAHNGQAWNSAADLNGDTFLNRADAVMMVEGLMANNSLFTIGPAGGTASNAAGTATLVFPAGAVSGPTAVSIGAAGSLPADARYVAGTAFTFGPSGVTFASAVTMTIAYDPTKVPAGADPSSLRICKLSGGVWEQMPGGTVDTTGHTCSVGVRSFSTYGILALASGSVYSGSVTVKTASDLAALSGYTGITGDLNITYTDTTLTNLDALTSLEWVGGKLNINQAWYLTNINGLSSLKTVGGQLNLLTVLPLSDLSPLAKLTSVGSDVNLTIRNATTLAGLDNLTAIGGRLYLDTCQDLTTAAALAGVKAVAALVVSNNPALTTLGLTGLQTMKSIGSVDIEANPALTSIADLQGLQTVSGAMTIRGNTALTALSFPALTSVGAALTLGSDNGVTSVTGFPLLASVGTTLEVIGPNGTSAGDVMQTLTMPKVASVGGGMVVENTWSLQSPSFGALTNVTGGLSVTNNKALTSLAGFCQLKATSSLDITSDRLLTSLDGISGVQGTNATGQIGHINIQTDAALTSISGFPGITSIVSGNPLVITDCPNLTSITFSSLTGSPTLDLERNPSLTTLSFPKLASVNNLQIVTCNGLTSLAGFEQLGSFGTGGLVLLSDVGLTSLNGLGTPSSAYSVNIQGCNSLTDLTGLGFLQTLHGALLLINNTHLTSLQGLNALVTIDYGVTIQGNVLLASFDGLNSLKSITQKGGSLIINVNPTLSSTGLSAIYGLQPGATSGKVIVGDLTITNNYNAGQGGGLRTGGDAFLTAIGGASEVGGTVTINNNG